MKKNKSICLFFQVHQPTRLRRYHFFDIGKSDDYFDDFANRTTTQRVARNCYMPMNNMLIDMAERYGDKFKVSFAISGITLELLEAYSPEVIDSFKELASTGCVEFVAQPYTHSLSSIANQKEFVLQVKRHSQEISRLFGVAPKSFCNTEMIFSESIGALVSNMGFKTVLTEGARHILGWKSPNYVYASSETPKLKMLMRNPNLSEDITLNFSNREWDQWPLTADKYMDWVKEDSEGYDVVNLFMDYETFGEIQPVDSGIQEFMKHFIEDTISSGEFTFDTVAEASVRHQPKAMISIPYAISWMDEAKDLSSWIGNELQRESYDRLNMLCADIKKLNNEELSAAYTKLQDSSNLYYMSSKHFGEDVKLGHRNPYDSPYEAFINYMNVISDITERVKLMKAEVSTSKRRKIVKNSQYEARENG